MFELSYLLLCECLGLDNSAVRIPEQLFSECERRDELNQTASKPKGDYRLLLGDYN